MIKGLWSIIKVYCCDFDRHKDAVELEIIENGFNGYFYACPKYHTFNREQKERQCTNRISPVEYENMIDTISNLIEEAENNNEVIDLTGYKWKRKGIQFEIKKYSETEIIVYMLNPKQLAH